MPVANMPPFVSYVLQIAAEFLVSPLCQTDLIPERNPAKAVILLEERLTWGSVFAVRPYVASAEFPLIVVKGQLKLNETLSPDKGSRGLT